METQTKLPETQRPMFDESMLEILAKQVGEILHNHHPYISLGNCITDAKDVLEDDYYEDGYKLTREFERQRYEGSSSLVEDLDSVAGDADDLVQAAVKKWVKENDIKLDLKVGDKIVFDAWRKNNEEGEIMKLYPETAQYGIWCESIGTPKGSKHYAVNFEKIKEVKSQK